jgi:adenylate cyclase
MSEPYEERERKFLVARPVTLTGLRGVTIRQGYFLPTTGATKGMSFRVRIKRDDGGLSTKGAPVKADSVATVALKRPRVGDRRTEFEHLIEVEAAEDLLANFCNGRTVEKTRYGWTDEFGQTWDIDYFKGPNEGLVLAEFEDENGLADDRMPSVIGLDVTDDDRYYNENLAVEPFSTWKSGQP